MVYQISGRHKESRGRFYTKGSTQALERGQHVARIFRNTCEKDRPVKEWEFRPKEQAEHLSDF